MNSKIKTATGAIDRFLNSLNHADDMFLMTFAGKTELVQNFTSDRSKISKALKGVKLASESLGQNFTLRITNAALRTLDFRGGLDAFLVKASDDELSPRAQKIKRQVKAKLADAQPAA